MELLYRIQIFIPSTIEGLNECLNEVNKIIKLFDFNFEQSFSISTVVVEAVENAFIHGNLGKRDLKVRILILIDLLKIVIEIEDQGKGFELCLIPSPLSPSNIHKESGRGIFFIRSLSSKFYTIGKGNIVRIVIIR